MNHLCYLTPGPSELYTTVPDHLRGALRENICSISHRSKKFKEVFAFTVVQLRQLMGIPEDYHVLFTSSATEVWERCLQNGVIHHSYHFVNGAFSKKFYEFAVQLGKKASINQMPEGQGFLLEEINIAPDCEMICVTQNETSTGVAFPVEDIYALRKQYPNALLVVDAVSSVPFLEIDYTQIDSLFFSVQKGFGLPAGLGVWIVNERMLEKAVHMQKNGLSIGTLRSLPLMVKMATDYQTPETPNVLNIYLLGKVAEDMLRRGVQTIRQETLLKAALAYQALEDSPELSPFVESLRHRSQTVIVGSLKRVTAAEYISRMREFGLEPGSGYGSFKNTQLRIANFPTHSKEQFYQLSDLIRTYSMV